MLGGELCTIYGKTSRTPILFAHSPADILTVLNVGGNKYRLIVRIRYDYQLVNVRAVLTHRQYDQGKWKE